MGDDRPGRYVEDAGGFDQVVYRASSLGQCTRAVVAAARDEFRAPWPQSFQEILDEGTRCEPLIRGMWDEKTGLPTVNDQEVVELMVLDRDDSPCGLPVIVRAHTDGSATADGELYVGREFKKFRDGEPWDRFMQSRVEVHPNYPWQVAAMMHATGWDWEFVGGRMDRETGEIVEVDGITIVVPPVPFKAIWKRIRMWERKIDAGLMPNEVECVATYPCPYYKLHDPRDDANASFQLPEGELGDKARELVRELANVGWELKAGRAHVNALDAQKKELSDDLREVIKKLGGDDAKLILGDTDDVRLRRVRKTIPEHVRKESKQDYYMFEFKEDEK